MSCRTWQVLYTKVIINKAKASIEKKYGISLVLKYMVNTTIMVIGLRKIYFFLLNAYASIEVINIWKTFSDDMKDKDKQDSGTK